ncbi:MAG: HAMP domain-containing protein [Chloroflexi bacterium]|nr:HAMP domain-containing protein [Chloroflexota bacterium]MCC6891836.1 HAMP domain-containing histidine kinase [Anaerolineae bacterium]
MNRLWVRLSLYFSIFILGGVVMFSILLLYLLSLNITDSIERNRERVISQVEAYYAENESWNDVENLLRSYDFVTPRGFGAPPSALVFADIDGRIIYDGTHQRDNRPFTPDEQASALSIKVDDLVRGYVVFQNLDFKPPPGSDPNGDLRGLVNGLVLVGSIAGILGLAAGIMVSRQLTAPLSELAETVRTFRSPNMSKRAPVKGTVEVREVATAFNQMADSLAESERLRRNMVGDVAHELRTPLTVLQANIQAMLDDLYPMNKTEIQNLQTQTDLLRRLVSDLHELAQAEAHQLPLHKMNTDMNELVQSLVDHFNVVTIPQNILLSAEVPPEAIQASVDPDRVAQVIQNLIQNALTHTSEGGKITVGLSAVEGTIQLTVKDTGAGISIEDQQRIFERFYRTDEARSRARGGAGLGLPISKAIVEMHNGTIQVSSDGITGHGTTFTIKIPLIQAAT